MENNILVTGGSGYVGTRFVSNILNDHDGKIINYDISYFGDKHLPSHKNYVYIKEDIRNSEKIREVIREFKVNTVLHLACISNDPTFELNNTLSKEINYDCFEPLVRISKENNVKKFIYASTCSVYGISDDPNVTEDHPLLPITDYNKYKAMCEPILLENLDSNFNGIFIRPATVCGYSEKMRFDLTVNILTNYAINKDYIRVFGGEQSRPNIHIDDICEFYKFLIDHKDMNFKHKIFNLGFENLKIIEIANLVKSQVENIFKKEVKINIEPSSDIRSYKINSDRVKKDIDFNFKNNVKKAIIDLCDAFKNNKIKDSFSDEWQNIKVLKKMEF